MRFKIYEDGVDDDPVAEVLYQDMAVALVRRESDPVCVRYEDCSVFFPASDEYRENEGDYYRNYDEVKNALRTLAKRRL